MSVPKGATTRNGFIEFPCGCFEPVSGGSYALCDWHEDHLTGEGIALKNRVLLLDMALAEARHTNAMWLEKNWEEHPGGPR